MFSVSGGSVLSACQFSASSVSICRISDFFLKKIEFCITFVFQGVFYVKIFIDVHHKVRFPSTFSINIDICRGTFFLSCVSFRRFGSK